MASLKDFMVDAKKEVEGVWVEIGDGLKMLIAGADNPEYRKYRDKILKPLIRKVRSKRLTNDDLEDLTKRAMAKHILLGWENLDDDAGKPIPYSHEKALSILRESRELFNIVVGYADDQAMFREESNEEAEKN